MGFLRRVHAVTLFDKVHRCEIRKALKCHRRGPLDKTQNKVKKL